LFFFFRRRGAAAEERKKEMLSQLLPVLKHGPDRKKPDKSGCRWGNRHRVGSSADGK
jgi:hypothetical protein